MKYNYSKDEIIQRILDICLKSETEETALYGIKAIKHLILSQIDQNAKSTMNKNIWLDGMMGLVVGDALGVPVQFMEREEIRNREEGPVTEMESGGVYNMPKGTWSDDSSMALATLSSILDKGEVDPGDIMLQFVKWELKGEYTPYGEAFDEGNTCSNAIYDFIKYPDVTKCGATGEYANGNGALMRILPVCLHYFDKQLVVTKDAIDKIHAIAGLTHNHLRSKICCGMYYFLVKGIIDCLARYEERKEHFNSLPEGDYGYPPTKPSLLEVLQYGIIKGWNYYKSDIKNLTELAYLGRIKDLSSFQNEPEETIKTTGYVIDTFEAAIWCLINTNSYKDCMLKAVNLGDDTDTVAAIAGGLAGLYYGYESIPEEWLCEIPKRKWIQDLCEKASEGPWFHDVPVVDTHSHCIFDVDDGAKSPEMAMELLNSLYLQGARSVICTSHETAYDDYPEKAKEAFSELQCRCASVMPDLSLYLGCEIYVEPAFMLSVIESIKNGSYPTMNGTNYVMIEFPTVGITFEDVTTCVKAILDAGYIPVIAHVERCANILNGIKDVKTIKEMGCILQINAYSIVNEKKESIKKLANQLLDEKMVDIIGSDSHRTTHRPPQILCGVKEIYNSFDKEYADAICFQNAKRLFKLS